MFDGRERRGRGGLRVMPRSMGSKIELDTKANVDAAIPGRTHAGVADSLSGYQQSSTLRWVTPQASGRVKEADAPFAPLR